MAGSPGSQRWLDAWNKQAEIKRERLARALSQNAITPRRAWIRQVRIERAQKVVDNRTKWAQAYLDNLKDLGRVLSTTSKIAGTSRTSSGSGNLSD